VDHVLNLLLPETDGGVVAQLVLLLVIWSIALWRLWRRPDSRLVVLGAGVVALGLMGLRALH
jgi:hypothetical protein